MKGKPDVASFYVFSITFTSAVASELRTLTFPLYAYILGYSPFDISLLFAVYYVVNLTLTYPFGLLSQRVGVSKVVSMFSVADAASIFLLAFHDLPFFIISFVLLGTASAITPQIHSLIAYNFKDKLKNVYSRMIAVFLAGNLIVQLLTATLGQRDLFSTIYFFAGILYLIFAAVLVVLLRGLKDVSSRPKVKYIPSRKLLLVSALALVFGFSNAITAIFVQIWFVKESLSVFDVSVIYMITSITGIASSVLAEKISEKRLVKFSVYILLSALYMVLTFSVYFPPPISVVSYISANFISPLTTTITNTIITKILNELNEVENGFALRSTFRKVGEMLGTLGQGFLFTAGDYLTPFALGAGLSLLVTI